MNAKFKLFLSFLPIFMLSSCGKDFDPQNFIPGEYEAKSSVYNDDKGSVGIGYGVVKLKIKNHKIVDCEYKSYLPDGSLKDTDYGKVNGDASNTGYYNKAQKALASQQIYSKQLLDVQDINKVDAITGATIIHDQFTEAVENALDQATKKYDLSMLKDGIYEGKTPKDHHGEYGVVTIKIENHKIVDCTYVSFDKKGNIKDKDYGRHGDSEEGLMKYQLAQQAISKHKLYVKDLLLTQDLAKVDAITGASRSHDEFTLGVSLALDQALEK